MHLICPAYIQDFKLEYENSTLLLFMFPVLKYSLNLVGFCAACNCLAATSYFAFIQSLYAFFSASTYHWQMLSNVLPPHGFVVISLSDTRWSTRADAIRPVFAHYREILKVATDICADTKQSPDTRLQPDGLLSDILFCSVLMRRLRHCRKSILI